MKYRDNWEQSRERLNAFLHGELIDRCCVSIMTPKDGKSNSMEPLPEKQEDKLLYWTDGERILKRHKAFFENTYFGGDAFPQIFINLGAAGVAGYYKKIRFQFENTVWFFPFIEDWEKDLVEFDGDSFLYRKTIELARYFVNESKGDFCVSMPDISGMADALAHMRGSENLLMDFLTDKDYVKRSLNNLQQIWTKVNDEVYDIVKDNNGAGSCIGWLDTWGKGKHNQLQCDLSVMISPSMFDEFIMPELVEQTNHLDSSVYHLDGLEQVRHLDKLLSLKNLSAIQWTCVAGQPSVLEFIPVFHRIQRAGKSLLLMANPGEVEPLMEQLSSKGLYLLVRASTEDEGKSILRMVEKLTQE